MADISEKRSDGSSDIIQPAAAAINERRKAALEDIDNAAFS
jgi:hypothetical protein